MGGGHRSRMLRGWDSFGVLWCSCMLQLSIALLVLFVVLELRLDLVVISIMTVVTIVYVCLPAAGTVMEKLCHINLSVQ